MSPENLFHKLRIEHIIYCPNPGNAGDALIAHSTYCMFNRLGIKYDTLNRIPRIDSSIIRNTDAFVYGGGGNLVNNYKDAANFLQKFHNQSKPLILLPHTISGNAELLADLGPNCHLFCRDEKSYEYASKVCLKSKIYLSHDLALDIDTDYTLNTLYKVAFNLLLTDRRYEIIRKLTKCFLIRRFGKLDLTAPKKKTEIRAFRTDSESARKQCDTKSIDLSETFAVNDLSPLLSHFSAALLFSSLRPYKTVSTDRLHVCIASALLGIHVNFYLVEPR